MKIKFNLLCVVFATLLFSCTLEKRQYISGYHITWKGKKSKTLVADDQSDRHIELTSNQLNKNIKFEPLALNQTENQVINSSQGQFLTEKSISAKNLKSTFVRVVSSQSSVTENSNNQLIQRQIKYIKSIKLNDKKNFIKEAKKHKNDTDKIIYILLAIFIPCVAVGLLTNWALDFWINLLLMLLFWLPAIIHAFIILHRKGII